LNAALTRINEIEVFNSFTPDHDGINDTWGVPELGKSEGASIQIFERTGSLIYSTENPEGRWDGTFNGNEVPEGTYFWVLNLETTGETRKGFLNLLRK
ncbi:MAG TPA: gliding motility-associated C-terminal domain-containing protein, partial [Algoriphagus sp.]|nr:gliding motility-associated C-terminal domain-containing protein [Algoriphagus sp.]